MRTTSLTTPNRVMSSQAVTRQRREHKSDGRHFAETKGGQFLGHPRDCGVQCMCLSHTRPATATDSLSYSTTLRRAYCIVAMIRLTTRSKPNSTIARLLCCCLPVTTFLERREASSENTRNDQAIQQITREMAMAKPRYVERALFLIGDQNTGKSTQLRSMFLDRRLDTGGEIPDARNLRNAYPLSNERYLYLRLTSPHETGEKMKDFLDKCDHEMSADTTGSHRWNFAGALQVSATDNLLSGPEVIEAFNERFSPERVRAAILSPDRSGNTMEWNDVRRLVETLRAMPNCEVMTVDATERQANGLMYADYFDFT